MKAAIFTGSRHWLDRVTVSRVFDRLNPDVVIEGGANGLDTIAKWEAMERKIKVITMLADWKKNGRAAGPIRNKEMLDKLLALRNNGYQISVQAFPISGGKGTQNMIRLAEKARVKVEIHKSSKQRYKMRAPKWKSLTE